MLHIVICVKTIVYCGPNSRNLKVLLLISSHFFIFHLPLECCEFTISARTEIHFRTTSSELSDKIFKRLFPSWFECADIYEKRNFDDYIFQFCIIFQQIPHLESELVNGVSIPKLLL